MPAKILLPMRLVHSEAYASRVFSHELTENGLPPAEHQGKTCAKPIEKVNWPYDIPKFVYNQHRLSRSYKSSRGYLEKHSRVQ